MLLTANVGNTELAILIIGGAICVSVVVVIVGVVIYLATRKT